MELWVVRHGQTLDNFTRILAGHQPGELSKLGVTQAQKTGKALQKEYFNGAYVSDLNRTRKTFENIFVSLKRCKNMKIWYESLMREKAGGDLEGQSIDLPRKLAQEGKIDIRFFRPKNGECWNDVFERAKSFLTILIERHIKKNLNLETLGKGYEKPKENNEYMPIWTEIEKIMVKNPIVEAKPSEKKTEKKEKQEQEEEKSIPVVNNENSKKIQHVLISNNSEKNIEETNKRKLSDNIHKKIAPSVVLKKKGSLTMEEKEKEDDKNMKKILVVSHGGFIMELFNAINFWMTKEPPVYKNSSQNCSINVIYVYCKNTKGRCSEKCPENMDCIRIDILRRNDIKHLIV